MIRLKKTFSISFFIVAVFPFIVVISALSTPNALGLMSATAEQVAIRNLQFVEGVDGANDAMKVTVINMGSSSATITKSYAYKGIIEGSYGVSLPLIDMSPASSTLKKATFEVINLTFKPDTLVEGTEYTVKLMTAKGNTFTRTSTYNSTSSAEYDPFSDVALQLQLQQIASRPEPGQNLLSPSLPLFVVVTSIAMIVEVTGSLLIYYRNRPISKVETSALLFLTIIIIVATVMFTASSFLFPPMTIG
jgi:hypothetical protein